MDGRLLGGRRARRRLAARPRGRVQTRSRAPQRVRPWGAALARAARGSGARLRIVALGSLVWYGAAAAAGALPKRGAIGAATQPLRSGTVADHAGGADASLRAAP